MVLKKKNSDNCIRLNSSRNGPESFSIEHYSIVKMMIANGTVMALR
jgi:hypothetical protein